MITMLQLFKTAVSQGASDLHVLSDSPPVLRVNSRISRIDHPPLTPDQTKELCFSILNENQKAEFENKRVLDFSFAVGDEYRFRGHLYFQKGTIGGAFRCIPTQIPQLKTLGFPNSVFDMPRYPHGLVLVTGPTGSGKSTTLASMVKEVNNIKRGLIITVEDPIEYVHTHDKCVILQKELGTDIYTFGDGLRAALREDPDVCLVGEMRDKETITTALHTAETGHLVLSTLHTNTAFDAVERVIGVFGGEEKALIRNQLSNSLRAVICQRLLPTMDGRGRVLCYELMYATVGVRNLIREGKQHQLYSLMLTQQQEGMVTFNQCLARLVKANTISIETALEATTMPKELETLIKNSITEAA
ncbi:MAG: type IV pilus twitching motility protein PilT [Bdellovibrionales bacterium]|nr:type IV pilus twitching motility protein PilT [Bdellovibrionales bacterium]